MAKSSFKLIDFKNLYPSNTAPCSDYFGSTSLTDDTGFLPLSLEVKKQEINSIRLRDFNDGQNHALRTIYEQMDNDIDLSVFNTKNRDYIDMSSDFKRGFDLIMNDIDLINQIRSDVGKDTIKPADDASNTSAGKTDDKKD